MIDLREVERVMEWQEIAAAGLDANGREAVAAVVREGRNMIRELLAALEEARQDRQRIAVALRVLNLDGHHWSKRPCSTCKGISKELGEPFGCVLLHDAALALRATSREGAAVSLTKEMRSAMAAQAANILTLTTRITDLERRLAEANEDRDEWIKTASAHQQAAIRLGRETAAAEGRASAEAKRANTAERQLAEAKEQALADGLHALRTLRAAEKRADAAERACKNWQSLLTEISERVKKMRTDERAELTRCREALEKLVAEEAAEGFDAAWLAANPTELPALRAAIALLAGQPRVEVPNIVSICDIHNIEYVVKCLGCIADEAERAAPRNECVQIGTAPLSCVAVSPDGLRCGKCEPCKRFYAPAERPQPERYCIGCNRSEHDCVCKDKRLAERAAPSEPGWNAVISRPSMLPPQSEAPPAVPSAPDADAERLRRYAEHFTPMREDRVFLWRIADRLDALAIPSAQQGVDSERLDWLEKWLRLDGNVCYAERYGFGVGDDGAEVGYHPDSLRAAIDAARASATTPAATKEGAG